LSEITNIAEEIKERADIVDHIGRVVKLRKRGVLWEGLCPFHGEKTPSFKVYENSQHYHCFGCGTSGDVISFYMKYYNLNFIEASTRLAEELHIDWTPGGKYESESHKKEFYGINREAALYYHQALKEPGNPGYNYLAERGILAGTMTAFGLGYAGSGSDGLSRHLIDKGLSLELASEMTLIVQDGGGYRDRYFNRIMFPLMNVAGMVIGFSARTIDPREKEKKIAKYINSSESKIFHKKENLYAINRTKDAISAANRTAILVEGQMDVVSVWQHGVANVTASLGTALTEQQAKLIKRFADHVVLAYDMDESGRDAAMKGGDILRAAGLDVRVMSLPSGKDPDEYIRARGRDAFIAQAGSATPYLEYKLTRILGRHDLGEKEGAITFLKDAAAAIGRMSPVERDYYVKWLEQMTGISAGAIEEEANIHVRHTETASRESPISERQRNAAAAVQNTAREAAAADLQRHLIRLLLHDPAFLADLRSREQDFTSPDLARIFRAIVGLSEEAPDGVVDIEAVAERLDAGDAGALRQIMEKVYIEDEPRRQLDNCFAQIDVLVLTERAISVGNARASLLNDGGEPEAIKQLTLELNEISRELSDVKERIAGKNNGSI
jgi:DNA primase